jgi:hypothetical protein
VKGKISLTFKLYTDSYVACEIDSRMKRDRGDATGVKVNEAKGTETKTKKNIHKRR